jgi:cytochrome c-type biogenesis protein CcmH/NrfG
MADAYNDRKTADEAWARLAKPDALTEAAMKAGLDALYSSHDPVRAAALFRQVLKRTPTHYGATYQLAAALDATGRPEEARPWWERMLAMAERSADKASAEVARARLDKPDPASDEMRMQVGLDALYKHHDANAAAAVFRKVLQQNPTHYGATYQLAAALDAAGRAGEARPLWEKVLQMAEGYNDKQTAETARARMARAP